MLEDLAKLHVDKGSNQGGPSEEDLLPYFEKQTQEYTQIAQDANA